jgi:hypothetical protein
VLIQPDAACMVSGVATRSRSGPKWPKSEIRTTTRPGRSASKTRAPSPKRSSVPGPRASTSTCASAINLPAAVASAARSTVVLYFPALRYSNRPDRLGSGMPLGKGPHSRIGSPDGGSILVTSAPRSACSLVQYGPVMSPAISTTRKPASAGVTPGFRWLSAPCTGVGQEVRRPRGPIRSA